MKYNGIELKEITEPQVFNQPRRMLVWDNGANIREAIVAAILPGVGFPVVTIDEDGIIQSFHLYCAEIPKPRRATWKELAYWLMDGCGLVMDTLTDKVDTGVIFEKKHIDEEVGERWLVMRRDDTDWHEPTAEYLGLEEK